VPSWLDRGAELAGYPWATGAEMACCTLLQILPRYNKVPSWRLPVYSRLLGAGSLAQPTDTGFDIGMDGNRKVYECIIGINIFRFVIAFWVSHSEIRYIVFRLIII
jgi:hypothetical protein